MEDIPWTEPATTTTFENLLALKAGSVESFSVKRLTEVGQNYGSILLDIQLVVRERGTLCLVGKFMPPTEILKEVFGCATTFLKEVNLYRSINSELLKLQREKGVSEEGISDPLPQFYGARVNSAGDDSLPADDNAILLLQNLTTQGYRMVDQMRGLDMTHAKMLVVALSRFQASVVALRLLKPEVFVEVIVGKCALNSLSPEGARKFANSFMDHISSFTELVPYYSKLKAVCERIHEITPETLLTEVVEPYASLCHNDLWINNMMFQYDHSKNPNDVKFFDFQTLTYSSPVRDLIFFIYTSLECALTRKSVDKLLAIYYDTFVKCLRKLGCVVTAFTEEVFKKEINRVAPTEIIHILMMLNVVCAEKHEKLSQSEMISFIPSFSTGEMYRKRVLIAVQDFVERGWL